MSLYGRFSTDNDTDEIDMNKLCESFAYDELSRLPSDVVQEFATSPEAQVLVERQVLKKSTLMRLSKEDDQKRRIKLTCYQLAKEANDPNWQKMILYRKKWKEYRAKIFTKYGNKATRLAKVAQKEYIKTAAHQKATEEQNKVNAAKM